MILMLALEIFTVQARKYRVCDEMDRSDLVLPTPDGRVGDDTDGGAKAYAGDSKGLGDISRWAICQAGDRFIDQRCGKIVFSRIHNGNWMVAHIALLDRNLIRARGASDDFPQSFLIPPSSKVAGRKRKIDWLLHCRALDGLGLRADLASKIGRDVLARPP